MAVISGSAYMKRRTVIVKDEVILADETCVR